MGRPRGHSNEPNGSRGASEESVDALPRTRWRGGRAQGGRGREGRAHHSCPPCLSPYLRSFHHSSLDRCRADRSNLSSRHHPLSPVFPSPLCIDPESVHQPADSLRFPSRRPPQKIKDSIKTLDKQARQITSLVNRIHSTPPAQRLSHSTYSCLPLPQPITSSDLSFSRAWTDRSFFLLSSRRPRKRS